MQGWIKLHRQIREHEFFQKKRKFSKFEAWIDILLEVNHRKEKFLLGNEWVECDKAQTITSIRKLSERWGWSKTKVVSYLKLLKNDQMIDFFSDTKKTVLTVLNWDKYQSSEDTKKTQKGHEPDSKRTQNGTNKNLKNVKNEKNNNNNNISSKVFADDAQEFLLANKLKTLILSNNPKARVPDDLQKWAYEIDKMMRLDRRTPKEIESVIEFSQKDSFWMANILSAATLRKQFDKLYLQSKRQRNMKPKQPVKTFWDNDYTGKGQAQEEEVYNPEIDSIFEETLEKMSKPKKGR